MRGPCASVAPIAAMVVVDVAANAHATPPGRNGRIVFQRHDANRMFQVWIAGMDSSEPAWRR